MTSKLVLFMLSILCTLHYYATPCEATNISRLNVSADIKYFIYFDVNPEHLKECVWVVSYCVLKTIHMSLVKIRDTKINLTCPLFLFCMVYFFLWDHHINMLLVVNTESHLNSFKLLGFGRVKAKHIKRRR